MKPPEIIHQYFESLKIGNIDAVLDFLDDDVVWNVAGVPNVPTVGLLRGKEYVRAWLERFPKSFQPMELVLDQYFTSESEIMVKGRFRHKILKTGRVAGSDIIIHFSFKDGLISRYQIFEDSAILSQGFDMDFPWSGYKQRINEKIYAYDDTHKGKPLIFTHGLFVNRFVFADQTNALSANHRCINMDMPAHGESSIPSGSWTLEDIADDLALFIEENHLGSVNYVGHSQGGMVGIRLAAKYPELINKLILIGASARSEYPERIANWKIIQKNIRNKDNDLDQIFKEIQSKIIPKNWLDQNQDKALEEREMMVANDREAMVDAINTAVINRTDVTHLLPKIQAKTLVICGKQDQATPQALSEEIAAAIPTAQLEILQDIGHHAPIEDPKAITKLIADFVKE